MIGVKLTQLTFFSDRINIWFNSFILKTKTFSDFISIFLLFKQNKKNKTKLHKWTLFVTNVQIVRHWGVQSNYLSCRLGKKGPEKRAYYLFAVKDAKDLNYYSSYDNHRSATNTWFNSQFLQFIFDYNFFF